MISKRQSSRIMSSMLIQSASLVVLNVDTYGNQHRYLSRLITTERSLAKGYLDRSACIMCASTIYPSVRHFCLGLGSSNRSASIAHTQSCWSKNARCSTIAASPTSRPKYELNSFHWSNIQLCDRQSMASIAKRSNMDLFVCFQWVKSSFAMLDLPNTFEPDWQTGVIA